MTTMNTQQPLLEFGIREIISKLPSTEYVNQRSLGRYVNTIVQFVYKEYQPNDQILKGKEILTYLNVGLIEIFNFPWSRSLNGERQTYQPLINFFVNSKVDIEYKSIIKEMLEEEYMSRVD